MKNVLFKMTVGMASVAFLSACGGSGGTMEEEEQQSGLPPETTYNTIPNNSTVTVVALDTAGKTASRTTGIWKTASSSLNKNGQTLAADTTSAINTSMDYVREVTIGAGGETYAIIKTPTAPSSGTVNYSTVGSVSISDASAGSVGYVLSGTGTGAANFNTGDLDITLTNLTGTKTAGAGGPVAFTGGTVTLDNLDISGSNIQADGNSDITLSGVDAVGFVNSTSLDAAGAFGGPSAEEFGAAVYASDGDTTLAGKIYGN